MRLWTLRWPAQAQAWRVVLHRQWLVMTTAITMLQRLAVRAAAVVAALLGAVLRLQRLLSTSRPRQL